jgi:pyruvate dehydrogenase E2 component (dihydrolipoamide acetyltransferase)
MPSLGADMAAGTLVEWLKREGDAVKRGDVVAVVETEKGAIEVEIFQDGILREILVPVGSKAPVGTPLARIEGAEGVAAPSAEPAPPAPPPVAAAPAPLPPATATGERGRASPAARRRARDLGVSLAGIAGTGVGGAVTIADVEGAAKALPARRAGYDAAAMRRAIAAVMSRSKREIPHYYLTETVDLAVAMAWLQTTNADRLPDARLLPAALFLKAVALGLAKEPGLNGFMEEDGFRPGPGVHVGWAIALRGGGLVAPAIHDADRASLDEIMGRLADIVRRARTGRLRSSELADPTVTVTSLGERGAEAVLPVIFPPQVAIVGFGRILDRPLVAGGSVVARPSVALTLAADHRASDGHRGGRLLAEIARLLQSPERL